ncbi:MAG: helix-turn-helix domain-containing protein [Anaerolineae bacterium]|nr:helix-turn-helix domain-containing protein [Anaerolineae bacterium]
MMAKEHIQLSESERKQLEDLLSHGNIAARKSRRILAILELDRGRTFKSVAQTVGVTKQAVSLWARNYRENGLTGLDDKPIPGRPPIISGAERAKITALACSEAPEGMANGHCGCWRRKRWSWNMSRTSLPCTWGAFSKKRPPTPPETHLVHWLDNESVSGPDGEDSLVVCPAS